MKYVIGGKLLTVDKAFCEKKAALAVLSRLLEIDMPEIDSFQPKIFLGDFGHFILQHTLLWDFESIVSFYQATSDLDLALKKSLRRNALYYLQTFKSGKNKISSNLIDLCKRHFKSSLDNLVSLCKQVITETEDGIHSLIIDGEFVLFYEIGVLELQNYVDLVYQKDKSTICFVEIKTGKKHSANSKQVKLYQEIAELGNLFPDMKIISEVWYPFEPGARIISKTRKNDISIIREITFFIKKCINANNLFVFEEPFKKDKICSYCKLCSSPFYKALERKLRYFKSNNELNQNFLELQALFEVLEVKTN